MDIKIKISLPKAVLMTLKNDCKNFNILKADGSQNFNAFINNLVINYYEDFSANEEILHDNIKTALDIVPDRYKEKLFTDMIKIIAKKQVSVLDGESTSFSFKPTKMSERAITFIENILIKSESISSYYRRMFITYVSKTQPQRERIIFKENYDILQKAIKKRVRVCIVTKGDSIKNTSVYGVFSAKEELYNYVLSTDGQTLFTIRLANIKSVSVLSDKSEIPEYIKDVFNRQIRCGVQYPIFKEEDKLIKVKFTEKGIYLFNRIYLYRPTPVKTDGNIYYFDCSTNQAIHYFKRLGGDAVIIEPRSVVEIMRNFYTGAMKKYNKLLER